ncbi:HAD-IA family hydrolase [Alkalibaculum sp. M08DMB]|uniref:HAD-IA family hydrolase n=1 Tax=Alkalibaculum sporogenes TaxID=2655001 RepID=A0A6A7K4B6_9FIRM|nr:HAD family hydrolase [Alkalibaculum sporogenes]MPW24211.1 HAD-IA family hydrolase [Alkalibaculum sporogenes]
MIIFDLDGTLVDSLEGIAFSMNHVLDTSGFGTFPTLEYKKFVGEGIKRLVYKALPETHKDDGSVNEYYDFMCNIYREHYSEGMVLYSGIEELLNKLTHLGLILAINTNKNQDVTDMIVAKYLKYWDFIKVIGSNSGFYKKPNPLGALTLAKLARFDPKDCLYIGDSEVDILTAKNAGMTSITVTWGFRSHAELLVHSPQNIVHYPNEILKYI